MPRPSQQPKPSPHGKVLAADWEGTGIATITYLSWSIPILLQDLQTYFGQDFCFKFRFKLNLEWADCIIFRHGGLDIPKFPIAW